MPLPRERGIFPFVVDGHDLVHSKDFNSESLSEILDSHGSPPVVHRKKEKAQLKGRRKHSSAWLAGILAAEAEKQEVTNVNPVKRLFLRELLYSTLVKTTDSK